MSTIWPVEQALADTDHARAIMQRLDGQLRALGIVAVWLYGSHAKGCAQENSDWDLMVEFSGPVLLREVRAFYLELHARFADYVHMQSAQFCNDAFFVEAIQDTCILIWES